MPSDCPMHASEPASGHHDTAAPLSFKDSWMAMGDFGSGWREAWVNYAVTARDAVGAGALYMRSARRCRRWSRSSRRWCG